MEADNALWQRLKRAAKRRGGGGGRRCKVLMKHVSFIFLVLSHFILFYVKISLL